MTTIKTDFFRATHHPGPPDEKTFEGLGVILSINRDRIYLVDVEEPLWLFGPLPSPQYDPGTRVKVDGWIDRDGDYQLSAISTFIEEEPEPEEPKWITRANVRLVSDGTLPGTSVHLVDDKGTEHVVKPVVAATWHMDANFPNTEEPTTLLTVLLGPVDMTIPFELVEFVREPKYTIMDVTPWYARLWLWWKKGWTRDHTV